ncbi:MAG: hypothetical protein OK439_06020 [Thaumarchaeota archaeon]|nr:hypothetical protein [Nitrososphaerota archaeon]
MNAAESRNEFSRSKLAMSLDYIFGRETSKSLNFGTMDFKYSRRTGRLKYIIEKSSNKILFTFRPNGTIAPTILGAKHLISGKNISDVRTRPKWTITVIDGVSDFISKGRTVFCKHVVYCSDLLRPGDDVTILNESGIMLATGKSLLAGPVLKQFKRGSAVKIREGAL